MQDIWFPSAESRESRIVGRFRDLEDRYTTKEGEKKVRVVTILEHKVPGSADISSSMVKPFNKEELVRRFPQAWLAYEQEKERAATQPPPVPTATSLGIKGTPIEELDFLGKDKVAYLKSIGFLTAEQLSGMSDTDCQNVGFASKSWRKKAAEHLTGKAVV